MLYGYKSYNQWSRTQFHEYAMNLVLYVNWYARLLLHGPLQSIVSPGYGGKPACYITPLDRDDGKHVILLF